MDLNALVIAASDPSGGAGLEADIKVLAAHGVNALSAITALTVQDSMGVRAVHPTSPEVFRRILEVLRTDQKIAAVKIGGLADPEHLEAVVDFLGLLQPRPPVVLDPLLKATSGAEMFPRAALPVMVARLLPLVTLVTPNIPEAEILTGSRIKDRTGLTEAAAAICRLGAAATLVKGGHAQAESFDVMCAAGEIQEWPNDRLPREFHGTGCALASAIAANLAKGLKLPAAIAKAREYLRQCLLGARPGRGSAYLLDFPPAEPLRRSK